MSFIGLLGRRWNLWCLFWSNLNTFLCHFFHNLKRLVRVNFRLIRNMIFTCLLDIFCFFTHMSFFFLEILIFRKRFFTFLLICFSFFILGNFFFDGFSNFRSVKELSFKLFNLQSKFGNLGFRLISVFSPAFNFVFERLTLFYFFFDHT